MAPEKKSGTRKKIIKVKSISKVFFRGKEKIQALSDTSLNILEGEFISLLGPSGCGKSTLLRIILGLEQATAGTVLINEKPSNQLSGEIGVMLQTSALMPWKSVRENVLLPTKLQGKNSKKLEGRVDELLEMVGLSAFQNAYPNALSGGMKQRVALARALLFNPKLLMLDEPFGALDHITREQLNSELASLCAQGNKTTLLVTHDINEAIYLSDRIVVMSARPGRVADILNVDLPKPRTIAMLTNPVSEKISLQIREILGLGSYIKNTENEN